MTFVKIHFFSSLLIEFCITCCCWPHVQTGFLTESKISNDDGWGTKMITCLLGRSVTQVEGNNIENINLKHMDQLSHDKISPMSTLKLLLGIL